MGRYYGMQKSIIFIGMLVFYMLGPGLPCPAFAQQRAGSTGINRMGPGNLYDLKTVETIKGEVLEVGEFAAATGMPPGVELILEINGGERLSVFVGPRWYLEYKDFEITPGDKISVKGSRILYEGRPAIVAAVIFQYDEVLRLRDENGLPVWSGWIPKR